MTRDDEPAPGSKHGGVTLNSADVDGDLVAGDKIIHQYAQPGDLPTWVKRTPEVAAYLEWLASSASDHVKLHGVAGIELRIHPEDVYVPLAFTRTGRARWGRSDMHGRELAVPHELELEALFTQLDASRHALVLGDPGTGKTTALCKLAQLCRADPAAIHLDRASVPVFVPLRWLTDEDLDGTLAAFVSRALTKASAGVLDAATLRGLLAHPQLLLLLDGLDEIADPGRRSRFCLFLHNQLHTRPCRELRLVVSSRFSGYDGKQVRLDGRFAPVAIEPLAPERASKLVHCWFDEAARRLPMYRASDATADATALVEALADPQLGGRGRVMFSTPLLLTLLCVVVLRGYRIPENIGEYYGQCLEVLLDQWHRGKEQKVPLNAKTTLGLLRPIAFRLHTDGRREGLDRDELTLAIAEGLDGIGRGELDADEIVLWLEERAQVLTELAPGHLGFFHLGVQEYLAAQHIAMDVVSPLATLERGVDFGRPKIESEFSLDEATGGEMESRVRSGWLSASRDAALRAEPVPEVYLNVWFPASEPREPRLVVGQATQMCVNLGPRRLGAGRPTQPLGAEVLAQLRTVSRVDVWVQCPDADVTPCAGVLDLSAPDDLLHFELTPRCAGPLRVVVVLLVRNQPIHRIQRELKVWEPEARATRW